MSLFVGRLSPETRTRDLEDLFYKYGKITRCDVKRGGFGFVEFEDKRDAEDAIRELDGTTLLGRHIAVEWAKGPRRGSDSSSSRDKNADACFKCGDTGHWARDCPNSGRSTKRRGSRSRSRSRSPRRRRNSRERERSPRRRSRSPRRDRERERSPKRGERSPKRKERSPSPRSRSPKRSPKDSPRGGDSPRSPRDKSPKKSPRGDDKEESPRGDS